MSEAIFEESVSSSFEQVEISEENIQLVTNTSTQEKKSFNFIALLGSLSINLLLPFINGLMLGFGEIIANEIGFNFNWNGARVYRPVGYKREEKHTLL